MRKEFPRGVMVCLILLVIGSCRQDVPITYNQAIENLIAKQQRLTEANPGKIVFADARISFIGARMPDSIGNLISGESVDQQFVANKITLFNFWFEGCPPCIDEIPELNEIVNKFGKGPIQFCCSWT